MAVSVTVVKVTKTAAGGLIVQFADGTGLEYPSIADVLAGLRELDSPSNPDLAKNLILAWWLARSPDGSNKNLIEGKTLTLDLTAPSPIKLQ